MLVKKNARTWNIPLKNVAVTLMRSLRLIQGVGSTRLEPPEDRVRKSISTETTFRDNSDRATLLGERQGITTWWGWQDKAAQLEDDKQCCGAATETGAARSRNLWPELDIFKFRRRLRLKFVLNHNSYWIGSKKWIKSIFFTKNHEKSTFSFKNCENWDPQS
jgi:hypothetical protein